MSVGRTYLDYNASAPLRPEARAAVVAALDVTGNASSVHGEGRKARAIVERARDQVAALVGAKPSEVVFTSGATEANASVFATTWDTIFLPAIEHPSVLAPAKASGGRVIEIAADQHGVVAIEEMARCVFKDETVAGRTMLALQLVNNETGVVQPVEAAAASARDHGVHVHCDAVQAAGRIAIDFAKLGVETLSLSSHKIGGPKGAGALVIRDGVTLPAFMLGGGQEGRRRGGTENVAAIAGFGAAAEAAARELDRMERVAHLRALLERGVTEITPEAIIIGAGAPRVANTACIVLPGKLAETLVIKLDLAGIAVSAGSACSSGKVEPSHVLAAMGLSPEIARGAIRVSLGPETTQRDCERFLEAWRAMRGARDGEVHERGLFGKAESANQVALGVH